MRYRRFAVLVLVFAVACTSSEELASGPDGGTTSPVVDGGDSGDAAPDAATDSSTDTSTGSDADPDAAGWTPKQLAGLSLWLDDTVGVISDPMKPGRVKRWLDQSGQGNNAESAGGDGVTSTPALDPAAVGGKNAIACDLQTYFTIASAPSLKFGTGDFGIIIVSKVTAPGSLLSKVTPEGLSLIVTAEATLRLQTVGVGGGVALLAGTPTDKFTVIVARGAALKVRVGTSTATGPASTADVSGDNAPVELCRGSITQKLSLAEVIAVKGTLTDADLTKALGYLNTKFGL